MPLDLGSTALQIDRMAAGLKTRVEEKRRRLDKALETARAFDSGSYEDRRLRDRKTMAWSLPSARGSPGEAYPAAPPPEDYRVIATDGSDIGTDRNIPARCYVINIGVSSLTYGSGSDAELSSHARLYASDEELAIRDGDAPFRQVGVEGTVLAAKRMAEEAMALAEAVAESPTRLPTMAIMDGSLIMLGLASHGYDDYVRRELVDNGLVRALDELRKLAADRPLTVASYVSMPGGRDVANALRLAACPYDTVDCEWHCGGTAPGDRPCDEAAMGIVDRDLFWEVLEPGQRSAVFGSSSALVANHYAGHEVHFFYVHAGEEIGRVEIPVWVADDERLLDLTHSLVLDQCARGPGYPVALMEAHEQAVITASDRRLFVDQVMSALEDQSLPAYTSEKSRSKRLRWI